MNVKSSAAAVVLVFWASSFAAAAEPNNAPPNGLMFPDSVERAMMGQAGETAQRLRATGTLTISSSGFVPEGPIEGFFEKSNPAASKPIGVAPEEPFVPFTPAAAPDPKDDNELNKATTFLTQGNLPKALEQLRGLRSLPRFTSEYVVLYYPLARNRQTVAARSMLEKALVTYPKDPEPWTILGRIALQESRNGEAELDFIKAKQLLAGSSSNDHAKLVEQDALNGIAQLAERRQNWTEAKARLEEYLKKSPEDVDALQRLALATFRGGNSGDEKQNIYAVTYKILERAKEIDKRTAEKNHTREKLLPAPAILAQIYGKYDRGFGKETSHNAENWFCYAVKQSPEDLNFRAAFCDLALQRGEMELAKEQVDAALKIEAIDRARPVKEQKYKNSTVGRMLAGEIALWEKRWPDAEDNFTKALLEIPDKFSVRNGLALALVEQDEPAKKKRALDHAYFNYQNNKNGDKGIEAAATLSWVYFRMGKFDRANEAMDAVLRAVSGNITDLNTATYLAYMLDHNDNRHNWSKYQAKQILEKELKSGRSFSMKPEAEELYKKLKDVKEPK